MRVAAIAVAAVIAVSLAPSIAFAGASIGVTCFNHPELAGCKKDEPAAPTNTRTTWDVEVVKPDAGEYSTAGSRLAKTQSDDFVGSH